MVTHNSINTPALTNKGDLLLGQGGGISPGVLSAGSNGYVLTLDDTQPTGAKWASAGAGTTIGPYIVGPTGSDFPTIQAAIAAAIAGGASDTTPANIYIKPGAYNENLTAQAGIRLIGLGAGASSSSNDFPAVSVVWNGTCTLSSGTMVFESIRFAYTGTDTVIVSGGNLKFNYCQFYGSSGTYVSTSTDGRSLEFETCFLNTNVFFSSSHWVDMRFQNSYLAGSFTIGGVGNQLIIEKSTIMSGFSLTSGSNGSFIFQWCDILSPILVDTTASSTAGISFEMNFCKAYSTSNALFQINKGNVSVNTCNINGNTYFIDDSFGVGSNNHQIRNSTVSNYQGLKLGANSNAYFYHCNLQGFGTPTLGAGANVHYIASITGASNSVTNTDLLSTSSTDGFLYIPSCNGTPTGTPNQYGSAIPMVYDTTNNTPWFYNGSWQGGGSGGTYVSMAPYVVGATHSDFTTIAAAIAAAITAGASNTNPVNIYIKPGVYSEDITLSDGINLIGFTHALGEVFDDIDIYNSLPYPLSSTINGTVTTGGTTASQMRIEAIAIERSTAGNAFIFSGGGRLVLAGVKVVSNNGTIITQSQNLHLVTRDCVFRSDETGGGVQFLNQTAGSLTWEAYQTSTIIYPGEITSTLATLLQLNCASCSWGHSASFSSGSTLSMAAYYTFFQGTMFATLANGAFGTLSLEFCEGSNIVTTSDPNTQLFMTNCSSVNAGTGLNPNTTLYRNCGSGNDIIYQQGSAGPLSLLSYLTENSSTGNSAANAAFRAKVNNLYSSAYSEWIRESARSWAGGIDTSNNDTWKLVTASTGAVDPTSGTIVIQADTNGNVTFPESARFNAYQLTAQNNITGDGSSVDVIFDIKIFDPQNGYNNSTGIYTIPSTIPTGSWFFYAKVTLTGVTASHTTATLTIFNPNRGLFCTLNPSALRDANNEVTLAVSGYMNGLGSSSQIRASIQVSGGAKVIGTKATGDNWCDFGGYFIG